MLNLDNSINKLQSPKIKERLKKYDSIISRVWEVDVSTDNEFQTTFNSFFQNRFMDARRQGIYYSIFESSKCKKSVSFKSILCQIFEKTGRIEASFSSKMLAVINPNMPIWDSVVLKNLDIKPSRSYNKEKRINNTIDIYDDIIDWYKGFMGSDSSAISKDARAYIERFNKEFPEYKHFSDVKKIDFLIWASR